MGVHNIVDFVGPRSVMSIMGIMGIMCADSSALDVVHNIVGLIVPLRITCVHSTALDVVRNMGNVMSVSNFGVDFDGNSENCSAKEAKNGDGLHGGQRLGGEYLERCEASLGPLV
jgi:hypothetical protein